MVTTTPLIEVVAHTIPLTIKLRLKGYMLTLIHILILTYTVSYTLRNNYTTVYILDFGRGLTCCFSSCGWYDSLCMAAEVASQRYELS